MIIMKIFLYIVILILIGLFGGLLVYWAFEDWWDWRRRINFRLSFDHFKQLYSVAPQKYDLNPGYVSYAGNIIGFSLLDWKKYKKWCKQLEKERAELRDIRVKKEFLEAVNRDIDAYKINSKKEIEELSEKIANGELPQLNNNIGCYRVGGGAGSIIRRRTQNGGF